MERLYLLDTMIASYILKGNSPEVDRHLLEVGTSQLAISTVTEAELRYGAALVPEAERLHSMIEDFFLRVAILPWDSNAARHYGPLRSLLERKGRPMGNLDTMIAAHALATGATLVTNDRAFSRIKKLEIEDWTKAPRQ
jgi:tRNA(fMet)-specific endonuclease VapC